VDYVIKKIFDFLLVGGTVGAYAMGSLILIIIGYFKYLRPYLSDFEEMKNDIKSMKSMPGNLASQKEDFNDLFLDIKKQIEETKLIVIDEGKRDGHEKSKEILNILEKMERDLHVLLKKMENTSMKVSENFYEIKVELARISTILNTGDFSSKGIKK